VVSTPYWHAAELLAEDRGTLVPFGDSSAIADEVLGLLRDDTRRHAMRKNAYKLGREMIWSNVAQIYMRTFSRALSAFFIVQSMSLTLLTFLGAVPGNQ
jgi:hypothetical protein